MARSRRRNADIGGYDLSPESAAGDDFDESSDDGGLISAAPTVELVDLYGNAGNNQPLDQLFVGIDGEAAGEAVDAMNAALATGDNPLSIVNTLAAILGVSQARAETIARTEMLGAWRDAQSINFRANSDVLDGWIWSADLAGACIACVMMDGTVHTLDEDLDSHPNCECCQLPLTKSWDDILGGMEETDFLSQGFEDGQDWFLAQPEAYQLEVLGPAKFEAWQSGDVELLDFVGQKDAGPWGNEIYERSLKEIGLDANAYLGRTTVSEFVSETTVADVAAGEAGRAQLDTLFADALQSGERISTGLGATLSEADARAIFAANGLDYEEWAARLAAEGGSITDTASELLMSQYQHFVADASVSGSPLQILLQEGAARATGAVEGVARQYTLDALRAAEAQYPDLLPVIDKLMGQMYANTQAWFEEQGITEITVYRGMRLSADAVNDGVARLDLQPLTSFTTDPTVAAQYGDVYEATIPVDRIMSTGFTGLGSFDESEVIVTGGEMELTAGRTTLADVTAGAAEEATAIEATAAAATEGVNVTAVNGYGKDQSAAVDKAIDRILGKDVTQQDVAALIGAPDDASVSLGTFKADMGGGMTDVIGVSMKGPEVADSDVVSFDAAGNGHYVAYKAERNIYRDAEGNIVIDNSSFAIAKDLQGQGLGLQVFSDEVQNAIKAGVDRIETMADGNGWSTYANGYYTWARFGYIGDIPQTSLGRLAADVAAGNVPTEWGQYTTVQELMQTQAGRAWWQANGSSWEGVFDLSEGSLSRKMLADYLREKGMNTEADAIATGGA